MRLGLLRSLNFGAKEWAVITGRLLMVFASDWKNRSCVCKNDKRFVQTAAHDLFGDMHCETDYEFDKFALSEIYFSDLKIRVNLIRGMVP